MCLESVDSSSMHFNAHGINLEARVPFSGPPDTFVLIKPLGWRKRMIDLMIRLSEAQSFCKKRTAAEVSKMLTPSFCGCSRAGSICEGFGVRPETERKRPSRAMLKEKDTC